MTDDISKVVREMRAVAEHPHATTPERKAARITDWADRLESATTPAEVDFARPVAQVISGGVNWTDAEPADFSYLYSSADYATLARQLAEAKAMLGQCYVMAGADTDGDAPERHAMDALRAVTDLRRDYDAAGEECYGRNGWQARAEQAESQLAEATRRLGEVRRIFESCVSTMVPADYANGYREALDHVDLALTKEPAK